MTLRPIRRHYVVVLAMMAGGFGRAAEAVDIGVNDAGDMLHISGCAVTGTGTCTLRDAITFANSNPGPDVIWMTNVLVRPRSPLPTITESVKLQSVWYPLLGGPGVIDGSLAGSSDGLTLAADACELMGLRIHSFEGTGIVILGSGNVVGRFVSPPCPYGGCASQVVEVSGNGGHGIEIRGGANNTLGFGGASLNGGNGIYVHAGATFNVVGESEYRLSFGAGGNRLAGIRVGDGPADTATRGNTIRGLFDLSGNGGLPIDLGGDGVTPNDPGDADTGPNGRQNFPGAAVALVDSDGVTATVSGVFEGAPNADVTLRFYFADTGASPFLGRCPSRPTRMGQPPSALRFLCGNRLFLPTPLSASSRPPRMLPATRRNLAAPWRRRRPRRLPSTLSHPAVFSTRGRPRVSSVAPPSRAVDPGSCMCLGIAGSPPRLGRSSST